MSSGPRGHRRSARADRLYATTEGNAYEASQLLEKGQPIGRPATVELRNQHAVYAATWFSLSGATSVMLALLLRKGPR